MRFIVLIIVYKLVNNKIELTNFINIFIIGNDPKIIP